MNNVTGYFFKQAMLALVLGCFVFSHSLFAQDAIALDEELPSILEEYNQMTAEEAENRRARRAYGYWYDNGQGPGQLPMQGVAYRSDILSGYGSGYMTNISYTWQGNFNGWSDVEVHLCIFLNNQCIASAEVTNSTSGNVSVPYGYYPASYDVAFVYFVNRPLQVAIYNGPTFGWVSANVQYLY